ncbi:Nephrocystin-3 [Symbiodinium microadriaticum]|uniref:Nephrocystin-3 n=2 Tax=Symbiodinium TaxID=2949 RepID=A0A1Q9F7B1_SYMMI|nr:Nephrocystin-3 [Symbiodinium microadriaticum]
MGSGVSAPNKYKAPEAQLNTQSAELSDYYAQRYLAGELYTGRCYREDGLGELLTYKYEAPDGDVHVWRHAFDLTPFGGGEKVVTLYHYTDELAFCNVGNMEQTASELFASLVDERAHFGKGLYATQHEPAVWGSRLRILLNNYSNGNPLCPEQQESRKRDLEWGDGRKAGHRAAFCIPLLVPCSIAYSIFERHTPDMAERTVKDSAGQERPIRLGEDNQGRAVHQNRDVWVIRLETDGALHHAAADADGVLSCKGRGRYSEAEELNRECCKICPSKLGPEHPLTLTSMYHLAVVLEASGQLEEAEPLYREALEKRQATLGPEHPDTLGTLDSLAKLLYARGNLAEAEPLSREAVKKSRDKLGPVHRQTLTSINLLATLLFARGNLTEAESLFREALKKSRAKMGEMHPETLISINNLATLLHSCGRLEEAEPLYREALQKSRAKLGSAHPDTLSSLTNLAALFHACGRFAEAEPLLREALEKSRAMLGPDHPETLTSLNNLAMLLQACGQLAEAEPLFREVVEKRRAKLGNLHPHTLSSIFDFAQLMESMQKFEEAEELYREELAGARKASGPAEQGVVGSLAKLALFLHERGKLEESQELRREYDEHSHGWRCLLLGTALRFVRTPAFVLQSLVDSWSLTPRPTAGALASLHGHMSELIVSSIKGPHGAALDNCVHHCKAWGEIFWGGVSNSEAFERWFNQRRWEWAKGEVMNAPSLYNGMVYGSDTFGHVFALDMQTGKQVWKTKVADNIGQDNGFNMVREGVALTACDWRKPSPNAEANQKVKALNASTGQELWTYEPDTAVWNFLPLFVDESSFVFQDMTGKVYRLNLITGAVLWKAGGLNGTWTDGGAAVGPNGLVYAVNNNHPISLLMTESNPGTLSAYNISDGQLVWAVTTPRPPNNAPAVGHVMNLPGMSVVMPLCQQVLPGATCDVHVYDAETGGLQWVFHGPSQKGLLQAGDAEGILGRISRGVRSMCLPNGWSAPTIDSQGTVFVGNEEGNFYALRDLDGDGVTFGDGEVAFFDTKASFSGSSSPAIAPGRCEEAVLGIYSPPSEQRGAARLGGEAARRTATDPLQKTHAPGEGQGWPLLPSTTAAFPGCYPGQADHVKWHSSVRRLGNIDSALEGKKQRGERWWVGGWVGGWVGVCGYLLTSPAMAGGDEVTLQAIVPAGGGTCQEVELKASRKDTCAKLKKDLEKAFNIPVDDMEIFFQNAEEGSRQKWLRDDVMLEAEDVRDGAILTVGVHGVAGGGHQNHVEDEDLPEDAVQNSIAVKGETSYYFAHSRKADVPEEHRIVSGGEPQKLSETEALPEPMSSMRKIRAEEEQRRAPFALLLALRRDIPPVTLTSAAAYFD